MQDQNATIIQKPSYLGLRILEHINDLTFPSNDQRFLILLRDCGTEIRFEVFGELSEWCWSFGDEFA